MSTVSLATLPQETLDAIVDAVASENDAFVTLRALAVTNRSILPRCRLHLFRVVRLTYEGTFPTTPFAHPRPTSTRLQGLFAFLNESVLSGTTIGVTPVGAFVQVLKVTNTLSPLVIRMTALMPNLRSVKVRANWNKEDERLCANHEALCQALGGIPQQLTPNSFNADLMGRISRCLNELDSFVAPETLGPLTLESLYVRQTNDRADSLTTFNFIARCLHLQLGDRENGVTIDKLEIYENFGWLEHAIRFGPTRGALQKLKSIAVGFSTLEPSALIGPLRLLDLSKRTLVSLELNLSHGKLAAEAASPLRRDLRLPLDLSSFPHLNHLRLINWPRSPDQPIFSLPNRMIDALSSFGDTTLRYSTLETVYITTVWKKWDMGARWDEDGSWARACRLVLQGKGFRQLKSFKVDIQVRKGKPIQDPDLLREAGDMLRKLFDLRESGIEGGVVCNLAKL